MHPQPCKYTMPRIIFPVLAALFLLLGLNACSPDYPDSTLPTKEVPPNTADQPVTPAPVSVAKPAPPEDLADQEEIAAEPGLLRVGFPDNSPPFIYKKDDKIQGIEADLLQQFGDISKKKVEFIQISPKKTAEALLENRIDLLTMGLKITSADKANNTLVFSDPYLRSGQILMVKTRNVPLFSNGIFSIEGSGLTIAVMFGSDGENFLTKNIRGIKIMRFKTIEAATKALIINKVDAFLHDAPYICSFVATHPSDKLSAIKSMVTEDFLGWQLRKDDEELRRQVNLFLKKSKANGQLQQTIKQWIPNL